MPQLHPYDRFDRLPSTEAAPPVDSPCSTLSDPELTRLIRSSEAPIAQEAADELRRRHLPPVLAYARICARDSHAAEQLATDAFNRAAQAVQAAGGPKHAWRHQLLMLVQRTAAGWATTTRRARLAPDFAAWLDSTASDAPEARPDLPALELRSPMLRGFRALPERTQAVLWHSVVEEDDDTETGRLLGLEPQSVPYLREKAREAYRDAYLQAHAEYGAAEECRGFSGLVEAAARRSGVHQNEDLDRHLAACPRCSRLLIDLVGISERPDAVLAEGLLMWGGAAYVAARLGKTVTGRTSAVRNPRALRARRVPAAPTGRLVSDRSAARRLVRLPRQFPALSAAAAVVVIAATAATTIVTLVPSNSSSTAVGGGDPLGIPPLVVSRTTAFATVTVAAPTSAAPPSASASASPSPSTSLSSRPASPPRTSAGTAAALPPPPTLGITYSELVDGRSGLCLDVQDQFLEQGADVIVHTCTGATSQKWYLDAGHLLRNYANPDFCLDSRGGTRRGVGVWTCASAAGRNGDNLRFEITADGAIRPSIDGRHELTPTGDDSGSRVALAWAQDRTDQQWRKGATAVLQE
ncbi:ricin-type beta-trefoil lectin domain protein [Peterkaempfera bronchialis]|uniref:Ricin B lectin domain-containing protein n=1 Tax=Peterkaempfera bronchialis TaxID=2126346 RepID=A0A345SX73_9ACTN|nr:ricin-type beta-trefoil lectin domain protein [Peterkaempfera bronchialis]AXI78328.1 hypothetical protein C7M71_013640 [Peterkaempfera bronchialis]